MMSHAVYLAAFGYEYHGPLGPPRLRAGDPPEDFRAAFTVAQGWGSYRQTRAGGSQTATVELGFGQLRVRTFAQQVAAGVTAVSVTAGGTNRPATLTVFRDRAIVTLTTPVLLSAGQSMQVVLS